jgi:hypothetical protein
MSKMTGHIEPMPRPGMKSQIIEAGMNEMHARGYAAWCCAATGSAADDGGG